VRCLLAVVLISLCPIPTGAQDRAGPADQPVTIRFAAVVGEQPLTFLESLTDLEFVRDARFGDPWPEASP
jgi:hypothetical protein